MRVGLLAIKRKRLKLLQRMSAVCPYFHYPIKQLSKELDNAPSEDPTPDLNEAQQVRSETKILAANRVKIRARRQLAKGGYEVKEA